MFTCINQVTHWFQRDQTKTQLWTKELQHVSCSTYLPQAKLTRG